MKKLIIGISLALILLLVPATALAAGNRAPKAPPKIVKPVKPSGWPGSQPQPDWSWLPPGFCHTW